MANDRLEDFALVERTNDRSDHVHQFEVLPFHVAPEQALRIRSEFKKPAVKLVSELSTDRPDRVERLSDKRSLFRRHDWQPRESGLIFARLLRMSRNSCGPLISLCLRSCRSSSVANGSPRRSISSPAISAALAARSPMRRSMIS